MAKVERQLSNKDLDKELGKVKFTKEEHAKQFSHLTEQTWFRQYGKGSDAALKKITNRVKKGIKTGKYGSSGLDTLDDGWKRFMKPKPIKKSKKLQKEQQKITKETEKIKQKTNRAQREKIKKQERKAPSGRVYSSTEIHEGVGSKRAKAYRKKHGIKEDDY